MPLMIVVTSVRNVWLCALPYVCMHDAANARGEVNRRYARAAAFAAAVRHERARPSRAVVLYSKCAGAAAVTFGSVV
jgi:hypothetical protein